MQVFVVLLRPILLEAIGCHDGSDELHIGGEVRGAVIGWRPERVKQGNRFEAWRWESMQV